MLLCVCVFMLLCVFSGSCTPYSTLLSDAGCIDESKCVLSVTLLDDKLQLADTHVDLLTQPYKLNLPPAGMFL